MQLVVDFELIGGTLAGKKPFYEATIHRPNEVPDKPKAGRQGDEERWRELVCRRLMEVPDEREYDETLQMLIALDDAGAYGLSILQDAILVPWRHDLRVAPDTCRVFVKDGEVGCTVVMTDAEVLEELPKGATLLWQGSLLITDEARAVYEALMLHAQLQKDLYKLLGFIVAQSYQARQQYGPK